MAAKHEASTAKIDNEADGCEIDEAQTAIRDLLDRASTILDELKRFEEHVARIGKSRRIETGRFKKGVETEKVNLGKVRLIYS